MPIKFSALPGASFDQIIKWLKGADIAIPNPSRNNDLLKVFLSSRNENYDAIEYDRFIMDFYKWICERVIKFYDPYLKILDGYEPAKTPAVQFVLRNLEINLPLSVGQGFVTAEDLFSVSVIWDAEVALIKYNSNLFIISQGAVGAVNAPPGYMFLAHTHPTNSKGVSQVDGDKVKIRDPRAEIVITKEDIIYYAKDEIINKNENGITSLDGFCIDRKTLLTTDLFRRLYTQYPEGRERQAKEIGDYESKLKNEKAAQFLGKGYDVSALDDTVYPPDDE